MCYVSGLGQLTCSVRHGFGFGLHCVDHGLTVWEQPSTVLDGLTTWSSQLLSMVCCRVCCPKWERAAPPAPHLCFTRLHLVLAVQFSSVACKRLHAAAQSPCKRQRGDDDGPSRKRW